MFLACLPVITSTPANRRLRPALFFSKKWLPPAWRRTTLPVLVMRTRFLVPLWVLILGILLLSYDKTQLTSRKNGFLVDGYSFAEFIHHPIGQLKAQIPMG